MSSVDVLQAVGELVDWIRARGPAGLAAVGITGLGIDRAGRFAETDPEQLEALVARAAEIFRSPAEGSA